VSHPLRGERCSASWPRRRRPWASRRPAAEGSQPPPASACARIRTGSPGARPAATRPGPFRDAVGFLEYCHRLGRAGSRLGSERPAARTQPDCTPRRSLRMFVEVQVGLPRKPADVPRFEAEVRAARQPGPRWSAASPRRPALQAFDSADAFRRFVAQAGSAWLWPSRAQEAPRPPRPGEPQGLARRGAAGRVEAAGQPAGRRLRGYRQQHRLDGGPMSVVDAYAPGPSRST